jgi:hypothetical protein
MTDDSFIKAKAIPAGIHDNFHNPINEGALFSVRFWHKATERPVKSAQFLWDLFWDRERDDAKQISCTFPTACRAIFGLLQAPERPWLYCPDTGKSLA